MSSKRAGSDGESLWTIVVALAHYCLRRIREHWAGTIAVAAFVVLAEPLLWPIDSFVGALAQNLATNFQNLGSSDDDTVHNAAIVKISEARFNAIYKGRSPLDRCELVQDLKPILCRNSIQTIGIDLDLSPVPCAEEAASDSPDCGRQHRCQKVLDDLLDMHADRLVLMAPPAGEGAAVSGVEWMRVRANQGVTFGRPSLLMQMGMVRRFEPVDVDEPPMCALGSAIRWHARRQGGAESSTKGSKSSSCEAELVDMPVVESQAIAFQSLLALHGHGQTLSLGEECLDASPRLGFGDMPAKFPADDPCKGFSVKNTSNACGFRTVIVGSGYTTDDQFETPVGMLDGVDLHAAVFACKALTRADERGRALADLLTEFLLGVLVVSPLVHWCWCRFHGHGPARSSHASATGGTYWWLVLLGLSSFALTVLFYVVVPAVRAHIFKLDECAGPVLGASFLIGLAIEAGSVTGVTTVPAPERLRYPLPASGPLWYFNRFVLWAAFAGAAALALTKLIDPNRYENFWLGVASFLP